MGKRNNILVASILIVLLFSFFIYKYLSSEYLVVPKIELLGENQITVEVNGEFKDPGVKASIAGKDARKLVKIIGKVDTKKVGMYNLEYVLTNYKGKKKQTVSRKVIVVDSVAPTITLIGGSECTSEVGSNFVDPGYTASDNVDGDITQKVKVSGQVDTKTKGNYELTYTVSDSSDNKTEIKRTVKVVDTTAPQIYLNGDNPLSLNLNQEYVEPGYSSIDNSDGNTTSKVVVTNNINTTVAGIYNVKYSVSDSSGNYNSVSRVVYVGTSQQINANTYIAVSINEQYIWFYQNGNLVISSPIVTGTRGFHDTPKGTYQILNKARNIYLTGPDWRSFVNYWMSFIGNSIGLHDASWRSSFGGSIYTTNGSHGCVNLPYNVAKTIYENASIGTKVIVY